MSTHLPGRAVGHPAHQQVDRPGADLARRGWSPSVSRGAVCSATWSGHSATIDTSSGTARPVVRSSDISRRDDAFVLHDQPGGVRPLLKDPGERAGRRLVAAVAGAVHQVDAQGRGAVLDAAQGALGEADVPPVDPLGLADERHRRGGRARRGARRTARPAAAKSRSTQSSPAGSAGTPISTASTPVSRDGRDAIVLHADVHEDHGVGAGARGDPPYPLGALVVGQQQHVVAVAAGRASPRRWRSPS